MNQALILSKDAVEKEIKDLPDWRFESDRLKAEYVLKDFDAAIGIINQVAAVSREMDHHPLMTNVFNRLLFSLSTQGVGDRVTELDVELAQRISEIISDTK
jgi:4a-hydroxytetrahydrobiopterin dehydratase